MKKPVVLKRLRASFHANFSPVDWQQHSSSLYLGLRFCYGFILSTFARRPLHNRAVVWERRLAIHPFVN